MSVCCWKIIGPISGPLQYSHSPRTRVACLVRLVPRSSNCLCPCGFFSPQVKIWSPGIEGDSSLCVRMFRFDPTFLKLQVPLYMLPEYLYLILLLWIGYSQTQWRFLFVCIIILHPVIHQPCLLFIIVEEFSVWCRSMEKTWVAFVWLLCVLCMLLETDQNGRSWSIQRRRIYHPSTCKYHGLMAPFSRHT